MRRRLIAMVTATTSMVLIALLLPMGALIERFAVEDALAAASLEVQATESVVALRERADLVLFISDINDNDHGTRTTVLFEDGDAIGPDQVITEDVAEARESFGAIINDTDEGAELLIPVSIGRDRDLNLDDADRPPPEDIPVVRVVISESRLSRNVVLAWGMLAGLGVVLLSLAVVIADRLARGFVRAMTDLSSTANQLESGHMLARAEPGGPHEVRDVAMALNRLADRIRDMLAAERESVADLSHRLRTPVTVLRLEAAELSDPDERDRITSEVDDLTLALSDVIRDARRGIHEAAGATSDARGIVRSRTTFWALRADDQHRTMSVQLPAEPVHVRVGEEDLVALVDALVQNVLTHTPEGVNLSVRLTVRPDGGAVLVVADEGQGDVEVAEVTQRGQSRGGGTGLGLDIVRRTAEASGGRMQMRSAPGAGTTVTVELGAAL